jgi:Leucine-rich repeat (LRR) protein
MKTHLPFCILLLLFIFVTESSFAQTELSEKERGEMANTPTYTSWQKALRAPSRVYSLNLSKSNLQTVSDTIRDMRRIVFLDLSDNKLAMLPLAVCELRYLEELNLSNNLLETNRLGNTVLKLSNI